MKVGILGGGQLGRMLLQAAANYVVETYVLENDENCPAAHLCNHFIKGDIKTFDAVYNFGKELAAITIEIESVNVEALEKLESEGVKVYPKTSAIKTIKDKVVQKDFYKKNNVASSEYIITNTAEEVKKHLSFLPAVHKIGQGGYDGKGVEILRNEKDVEKAFNAPSVLEKMVDIKKEIAVIVAMNDKNETAVYEPVEMVFDPKLNLLDYQLAPANIADEISKQAQSLALKVVQSLNSAGLFAVEMFIDKDDTVLVNETAPRVHNSGHHTIEANYCSQFDMLWRVILNYPLGNTETILPSCMINIIGADGSSGEAKYNGLNEVLSMQKAFVHLYGKEITKPGRKMGHVTVLSNDENELKEAAAVIKNTLKVIS